MSMSDAPPSEGAGAEGARGATWAEARGFLREHFAVARDSDELVALAWRIPMPGAPNGEFLQWVRVSPISVHGEPWLTILAEICPQSQLPAATAFEYLNQLPFGALIAFNGVYAFRHSLALAWLALPELEHAVRLVAHEAVRLRFALAPQNSEPVEARAMAYYDE